VAHFECFIRQALSPTRHRLRLRPPPPSDWGIDDDRHHPPAQPIQRRFAAASVVSLRGKCSLPDAGRPPQIEHEPHKFSVPFGCRTGSCADPIEKCRCTERAPPIRAPRAVVLFNRGRLNLELPNTRPFGPTHCSSTACRAFFPLSPYDPPPHGTVCERSSRDHSTVWG